MSGPGDSASGSPRVADTAPDVSARNQHGTDLWLHGALKRGPVLLVFYPFAFTGTCTGELQRLRELHQEFTAAGITVWAVSCDSMFSLRVFAENEDLPFDLVSDFWPHGEVARAYGVLDEDRGAAVRGSFLVDTDGHVRWSVVNPIGEGRDIDAHLAAAKELVGR